MIAGCITPGAHPDSYNGQDAYSGHLIAHTLRAEGFDAGEDGTGRGTPIVAAFDVRNVTSKANRTRVEHGLPTPTLHANGLQVIHTVPRRLTPRECERLQGFPDDWTQYDADGREIADGPRYRMLGNAVTVPVAEWIGRRLMAADGAA